MLRMCQNTTMWIYGAWIKNITFYVQKHTAVLALCYNPALVRDKLLGVPASVELVYYLSLPEIPASVFCTVFYAMQLLIPAWDTCLSILHSILCDQLLIPAWDTCFSILHNNLWDTITYPCLRYLLHYSAQYSVGWNYLSLPEIPASGTNVLIYASPGLNILGLWCQKQVSQTGISNCISKFTVGCSYLSLPEIPASGTKVLT